MAPGAGTGIMEAGPWTWTMERGPGTCIMEPGVGTWIIEPESCIGIMEPESCVAAQGPTNGFRTAQGPPNGPEWPRVQLMGSSGQGSCQQASLGQIEPNGVHVALDEKCPATWTKDMAQSGPRPWPNLDQGHA